MNEKRGKRNTGNQSFALSPMTRGNQIPTDDTYEIPESQGAASTYWAPPKNPSNNVLPGQVPEDGEVIYDARTTAAEPTTTAPSSHDIYAQPNTNKKKKRNQTQDTVIQNPAYMPSNASTDTGYLGTDPAAAEPLYDAGAADGTAHLNENSSQGGGYLMVGDQEEEFNGFNSLQSNASLGENASSQAGMTKAQKRQSLTVLPGSKRGVLQFTNHKGQEDEQIYDMGDQSDQPLNVPTDNDEDELYLQPGKPVTQTNGKRPPQPPGRANRKDTTAQDLYEALPGESDVDTIERQRRLARAAGKPSTMSPVTTDPNPMARYALPKPPSKKQSLPPTEAELEAKKKKQRKFRRYLIAGAVTTIVILAGVVGVIFALRNGGGDNNSPSSAASTGVGVAVPAELPDYAPVTGFQAGQAIPLDFKFDDPDFKLDEGDSISQISFAVADLPSGTSFNRGRRSGALWVMSLAQAQNNLKITFPNHLSGDDLDVTVPFFIETQDGTDKEEVGGEINFILEAAPTTTTTTTSTTIPTTTSTSSTVTSTTRKSGPGIAVALTAEQLPKPTFSGTVGDGIQIKFDLSGIPLDAGDTMPSVYINKLPGATFNLGTPVAPTAEHPNGRQLFSPGTLSSTGAIMTLPGNTDPGQIHIGYTVITADGQSAAESAEGTIEVTLAPKPTTTATTTATTTPTSTATTTATTTQTSTPTTTPTSTATSTMTTVGSACYGFNLLKPNSQPAGPGETGYCECPDQESDTQRQIDEGLIPPSEPCLCPEGTLMYFENGEPTNICSCGLYFFQSGENAGELCYKQSWERTEQRPLGDCQFGGTNSGDSNCQGIASCDLMFPVDGDLYTTRREAQRRRDASNNCDCVGGSVHNTDTNWCDCPDSKQWDHLAYKCVDAPERRGNDQSFDNAPIIPAV